MEIFFVYSLVPLFLVGFAVSSVLILATLLDREEAIPSASISTPVVPKERFITYVVTAALFLFFLFLALQREQRGSHYQLEIRK